MRLINADELKKAFVGNKYGTQAIEYYIDNAPTVDPVKHGHWTRDKDGYFCSVCGLYFQYSDSKYCPHCGARMDEVEDGKTV